MGKGKLARIEGDIIEGQPEGWNFEREEKKPPPPRKPQAEFDFHGAESITPHEVIEGVRHFIAESVAKKLSTVLIITGKGLRSKGVPVVKTTVQRNLGGIEGVKSFRIAPPYLGGNGAFLVELDTD